MIMKTIFSLIVSCLVAVSAMAATIRVSVKGNQDVQVVLDGQTYLSSNYTNREMVFQNLAEGSHTVVISKINRNGRARQLYSSTVILDANKEVRLSVAANGSISREEFTSNEAYGYRTPMSASSFNQLYRNISNQWGQSARLTRAREAFDNAGNNFTTSQVMSIIRLINAESGRLELAKLSYDNITDLDNVNQLYSLLNSRAGRAELENYIRNYDSDTNNSYKVAMGSAGFNQLYQNIQIKRGTSARYTALSSALNNAAYYFNIDQVVQLISLVNSESQRLELAKLSLDNLVDQQQLSKLFELLASQASRNELDLYIRNNGFAGSNYSYDARVAMSTTEFTNLYENIRKKWLPLGKYSAAADAFNTSSYHFTTAQAKQIIALLSSESNRVELAKLAFDNIVDQQNFRQMYDLFESQASRQEVDEYLKTNYNYSL